MATLLEQGIAAAKQGDTLRARRHLTQVLHADNVNERAWLWLSQVVETPQERIKCLEQVVHINPHHAVAQQALQKLGVPPPLPPLVTESKAISAVQTSTVPNTRPVKVIKPSPDSQERRPFRLQPDSANSTPETNGSPELRQHTTVGLAPLSEEVLEIHHDNTVALEPVAKDANGDSPALSAAKETETALELKPKPKLGLKAKSRKAKPAVATEAKQAGDEKSEDIPLVFIIICGVLLVTALGGSFMLLILAVF